MENPPKYPRSLHWPESPTIHKDDKVHSNPTSFVGREVVITEKMDGGNTCLWNGEVYARSTSQPSNAGWMGMVRKHHAWKTHNFKSGIVNYGEDISAKHSIHYTTKENETFRLFSVRDVSTNDFFHAWDTVEWYAKELDVPTVPLLFRGTFGSTNDITKWFDNNLHEPSVAGVEREGFVIRWADKFNTCDFSDAVAKYVRKNHVQPDSVHWRTKWEWNTIIPI